MAHLVDKMEGKILYRLRAWGPLLRDLADEVEGWAEEARLAECEDDGEGGGVDLRLQVVEGEGWALWAGSPDYDTDHRGWWGSGWVEAGAGLRACRAVARELLDGVAESIAQSL